ncbi:calponin homology domain-containing protein DDB_G0272472-like isoform X2 [Punica granatum]|uniref:Calponin homology domain-containing protein DDB_G0272472-like isoform X2 n=1 Tax=Punica granatum TaxID=22663 RepID=A0A6P8D081_PUNGR|nr:calponin homology domain-containing protein DDB_G0272472-like isoform X2 [Punica granatum]
MASSQVEIAASAPFGCILRDHNRRDRCRESNAFRKNLQDLVTCINISPDSKDNEQRGERQSLKLLGGNQEKYVGEEPPLALSPRQSRVLDRWATQQARDTISTIEKQSDEPEHVVCSTSALSSKEAASVAYDHLAAGPSNLGASSLVQIWEARLGQSHGLNRTPTASSSRGNSPFSCSNEEPPRKSEVGEMFEESRPSHEGSIGDQESDWAVPEGRPPSSSFSSTSSSSSQDRDTNTGTSLKTPRVADIIRRLTSVSSDENDNEPCTNAGVESPYRERERSVGSDHSSEQRFFAVQMTNSPRLRGRQALNDLLMHMERDRQRELDSLGERRAVSRFSQKGRIQSLLRLKVLQRGMGVHLQTQQQQRPGSSSSAEGSSSSHSSTVVHLGEKFKVTSSQVAVTTRNDANNTANNPQAQPTKKCASSEDSSSISGDQSFVRESDHMEVHVLQRSSHSEQKEPITAEDIRDDRSLTSNITYQETGFGPATAEDLQDKRSLTSNIIYQETGFEQTTAENFRDERSLTSNITYQETGFEVNSLELQEKAESFTSMNGCWYEEETAEEERQESNMEEEPMTSESGYEWFLGVSRPRSYWEEQREARYRDVLETESENSDIRRLVERRRVSTFLTSDFRDRMNSLMASHLQRQNHQMSHQEDDPSNNDRMNRFLSSFLRYHSQSADGHGDEQEEEPEEEEVEGVVQVEEAEEVVQEEEEEREQIYLSGQERMNQSMEEEEVEEEAEEEQIYLRGQERMGQLVSSRFNEISAVGREEGDDMGIEEREYREDEEQEEQEEQGQEDEEQGHITIEENEYEQENDNDAMADLEEEEDESTIGGRYHEAREYFNHSNTSSFKMRSPTYMRSWSYRSCEANNNDLQPVASTSSPEPLNSHPYQHDAWQHFNSIDRLSIEMELINDLRAQMKQLYQEMSELRKSINSCVDMQVKLQDSIKEDMISFRGERMKPQEGAPRKGMCCICYEMQVDSLLYRCGHMCTCLKCAHELQWSSGKCPICRAPIMDVVRAFRDS